MENSNRFTVSFFNQKAERVLLLHSYNFDQAIVTALTKYNLKGVSFINVFEFGVFKQRHYVRSNQLTPFVGYEYELSRDELLKSKLVSDKPLQPTSKIKKWNQFQEWLKNPLPNNEWKEEKNQSSNYRF